jgi:LysM repeat protein
MYHLVSLAAKTALVATTSLSGHTSAAAAYTVQSGDTLSGIAAANGMTWQAVYAANQGVIGGDPNVLYVGEQLALPGSAAPAASAAPAQTAAAGPSGTASDGASDGASGTASGQAGGASSSYLACVRYRESTDGAASSNQFGITQSTWSAYGFAGSPDTASYGEQVAAFQTIYAAVGSSAWSPYDGC